MYQKSPDRIKYGLFGKESLWYTFLVITANADTTSFTHIESHIYVKCFLCADMKYLKDILKVKQLKIVYNIYKMCENMYMYFDLCYYHLLFLLLTYFSLKYLNIFCNLLFKLLMANLFGYCT